MHRSFTDNITPQDLDLERDMRHMTVRGETGVHGSGHSRWMGTSSNPNPNSVFQRVSTLTPPSYHTIRMSADPAYPHQRSLPADDPFDYEGVTAEIERCQALLQSLRDERERIHQTLSYDTLPMDQRDTSPAFSSWQTTKWHTSFRKQQSCAKT